MSRGCSHSLAGVPLPETASLPWVHLQVCSDFAPPASFGVTQVHLEKSGQSPQLKILNLITSAKSPFPNKWTYSQVLEIGTWTSLGGVMTPATAGSPVFLAVSSLEATHMHWIMASCGQQHQDWSFLCWRLSGPPSSPFTYPLTTPGPLRITQDNPTTLKSDGNLHSIFNFTFPIPILPIYSQILEIGILISLRGLYPANCTLLKWLLKIKEEIINRQKDKILGKKWRKKINGVGMMSTLEAIKKQNKHNQPSKHTSKWDGKVCEIPSFSKKWHI